MHVIVCHYKSQEEIKNYFPQRREKANTIREPCTLNFVVSHNNILQNTANIA